MRASRHGRPDGDDPPPAPPDQLRHWFGTRFYGETKDLRLTQEVMGHATPVSTAGYAAFSQADAIVAVRALRVGG